MTVGSFTVGVEAAPTAGITSYTSNIATSSAAPTAGISLAMSQCAALVEDEATVASAQPKVTENETPVVKSEYEDIAVATVNDYVNVRKKASKDSKSIGKLYKNNVGTVIGKKGDWYKIKSGSVIGYVKSDYVKVGDEELAKSVGRRVALVTTETLKVRKKSSKKAEVISLVPGGDDLTVIDESVDGWVGVSVDEGDGYVSADYVTLSTEYTYAESAEEEAARLKKEEEERKAAEAAAQKAEQNNSSSSSSSSSSNSSSSGNSDSSYTPPTGSTGAAVASYACQFVGNPYVYGGSSLTNGTDCSGFVMAVYAQFGVSLPHSSSALRSVGYGVSTSEMQPGDIVCYSGHVGIYVGNNTIVHASNRRDGIKLTSPANYRTILAVRRIF
ncbi:MAG: NlpC/P60 family protein [Agathobacter sp.]|nr:NlpC/P60 family protein [Agathobacter sp.]